MPLKILIQFAQAHPDFRIPELLSVAQIYGFDIVVPPKPDVTRPFMTVEVQEEEHARLLAQRCILVKSVLELYASGPSYSHLHTLNRTQAHLWAPYKETPWKFMVTGYRQSVPKTRQREVVEGFSYMALEGRIDLTQPELELWCFEEYGPQDKAPLRPKYDRDGDFICVWFGRLIAKGTARPLIHKFDVKKRAYYGNTSMDAEMSLLMANQTLSAPGKLIYDPFAGTGSMLYTAAEFGAYVVGSDIDGRQMRGKERAPGVLRSAAQYGFAERIFDLFTFDVTWHPWRCGALFDAIVTDPPYGVRAGAKRLGRKQGVPLRDSITAMKDPSTYVPPTHPYELSTLAYDLVLLARFLLRPRGRLVFFLPTVNEEYAEVDVPQLEGMVVISNSLENFGAWGRRLITMVKTEVLDRGPPDLRVRNSEAGPQHVPAHKDFREKYFAGFNKPADTPS
ncbi:tRNA guanosine-2'-O-methyltransferase [Gautieria morchelliformis]|nr:tRNA guanosine-2'-O-methyltransferase [Gautieria morchelliformis]